MAHPLDCGRAAILDRDIEKTCEALGADGVALRDDRGRVAYAAPLIEFASRQAKDRFTEQVIEALRLAQPQVFAAERVPT